MNNRPHLIFHAKSPSKDHWLVLATFYKQHAPNEIWFREYKLWIEERNIKYSVDSGRDTICIACLVSDEQSFELKLRWYQSDS